MSLGLRPEGERYSALHAGLLIGMIGQPKCGSTSGRTPLPRLPPTSTAANFERRRSARSARSLKRPRVTP